MKPPDMYIENYDINSPLPKAVVALRTLPSLLLVVSILYNVRCNREYPMSFAIALEPCLSSFFGYPLFLCIICRDPVESSPTQ